MRMIDRTPKGARTTLGGPSICLASVQEEEKRNTPAAKRFCAAIDKLCNGEAIGFWGSIRKRTSHLQGGLR